MHEVTGGYKALQRVTKVLEEVKEFTKGYKR